MINLLSEYELALGQLPVEPDSNQVFYVESKKNPMFEEYIRSHYIELRRMFAKFGLEFVYLPMADSISAEDFEASALYYFPWLKKGDMRTLRQAFHINPEDLFGELHLKDDKPAIINAKGRAFKLDVPSPEDRFFSTLFYQIAEAYGRKEPYNISDSPVQAVHENKALFSINTINEEPSGEKPVHDNGIRFSISSSRESRIVDPELMRMFNELVERKPIWVVKAILAKHLEDDEVISRLVITRQCKLLLPDYNNMEIRLTPKEKAIYILYLKHPEGITFKNLPGYRDELGRYYRHVTGRDDPKAIAETIDKMVLSISGDADVQRARIKYAINKAFTSQFCEQYARYYTIEGSRGEALKIELPREKVVWEADI